MDQLVKLNYLSMSSVHEAQRPYIALPGLLKTVPRNNCKYECGPEQLIRDVRGLEEYFTLQDQGFTFRSWSPTDVNWKEEHQIENLYLPQVKELLRKELDIGDSFRRCEVFDWRVCNYVISLRRLILLIEPT